MDQAPHWRFSHIGLFVKDLERMAEFYKFVFSMIETDGGKAREHNIKFLSRDPLEHHQLVLETSRKSEETTIQQISFRFLSLDDLRIMKDRITSLPGETLDDRMLPYGVNHGTAWSLYCHDPEGNRIEMFVDSPFYVRQPRISTLDFLLADDEILKDTKDKFSDDPSFKLLADWTNEMASRLKKY
jgi:catechol-2,3-dioxygenase